MFVNIIVNSQINKTTVLDKIDMSVTYNSDIGHSGAHASENPKE